jgi:hypothetical protein
VVVSRSFRSQDVEAQSEQGKTQTEGLTSSLLVESRSAIGTNHTNGPRSSAGLDSFFVSH